MKLEGSNFFWGRARFTSSYKELTIYPQSLMHETGHEFKNKLLLLSYVVFDNSTQH
jgi:hypothetical protein